MKDTYISPPGKLPTLLRFPYRILIAISMVYQWAYHRKHVCKHGHRCRMSPHVIGYQPLLVAGLPWARARKTNLSPCVINHVLSCNIDPSWRRLTRIESTQDLSRLLKAAARPLNICKLTCAGTVSIPDFSHTNPGFTHRYPSLSS